MERWESPGTQEGPTLRCCQTHHRDTFTHVRRARRFWSTHTSTQCSTGELQGVNTGLAGSADMSPQQASTAEGRETQAGLVSHTGNSPTQTRSSKHVFREHRCARCSQTHIQPMAASTRTHTHTDAQTHADTQDTSAPAGSPRGCAGSAASHGSPHSLPESHVQFWGSPGLT